MIASGSLRCIALQAKVLVPGGDSGVSDVLRTLMGVLFSQNSIQDPDALTSAGVQARDIYSDVTSGSKEAKSRPGMQRLMSYAQNGDTIVVWRSWAYPLRGSCRRVLVRHWRSPPSERTCTSPTLCNGRHGAAEEEWPLHRPS
jgi:Resolvase, N terminal domain